MNQEPTEMPPSGMAGIPALQGREDVNLMGVSRSSFAYITVIMLSAVLEVG